MFKKITYDLVDEDGNFILSKINILNLYIYKFNFRVKFN